jgi:hypothetical protein
MRPWRASGPADPRARADGQRVTGRAHIAAARRLCASIGIAAIVAGVAAGCAGAAVHAGRAAQSNASGLISAINGESLSEFPSSTWNLQLAAIAAQGVQVVRSDAPWTTIEPSFPGALDFQWQFGPTDAWVRALASENLRWQPILDYNNWWANAASDPSDFAAYAQQVALRYGPGGTFWTQNPQLPYLPVQIFEVWNEEGSEPYYISPADYGPLYSATHDAIHDVDPTASVDVGGLADDSESFYSNDDYPSWYVTRMLDSDPSLVGHVDGFALHPYGTTATDVIEWLNEFRYILDGLGESSAPIDITEFGWVTGDDTQEQWRVAQMTQLGKAFEDSTDGLREVAPYDWINSPLVGDTGDFGFVGQTGTDATLRPAAVAWFHAFAPPTAVAPTVTPPAKSGSKPVVKSPPPKPKPPVKVVAKEVKPQSRCNATLKSRRKRAGKRAKVERCSAQRHKRSGAKPSRRPKHKARRRS